MIINIKLYIKQNNNKLKINILITLHIVRIL